MDHRDLPGNEWRLRACHCGCDTFRLQPNTQEHLYLKICRNCNHTLSEHITLHTFGSGDQ